MDHLVDSIFPSPPKGSVPLLQTYAEDICSAVQTISTYCTSEALPHPSFDPQAPSITIPSTAPLSVQNAREKLIASAAGIQRLATEPAEYLPNLAIYVRQRLILCESEVFRYLDVNSLIDLMSCVLLLFCYRARLISAKSVVPACGC